jgi:phosphoglycolate phosphatase
MAVIFDLDGTLVDSLEDIGEAMNAVLTARGLPPRPLSDYRAMLGWGMRRLVTLALPESQRGPASLAEAVAAMTAEYERHPLVRTRPYPGVPELLAELGRRGIPVAVLSNKPDALTQEIVAGLFPPAAFRRIQGDRPGLPRKPDPTVALALCADLGVAPAEVLLLGDTAVDMETARRAGTASAGALWGYRDRDELVQAGAGALLADPLAALGLVRA